MKITVCIAGGKSILSCEGCGKQKVVIVNERFDLAIEKERFETEHNCRE